MILTCQKCTKRYLIDTAAISIKGRTVRCVACGHTWAQPPLEASLDDSILSVVKGLEEEKVEDPPLSSRAPGWGWASFLVVLLSLIVVFIAGRDYISHQWPVTQSLYHRMGLKISKPGAGLVIKDIQPLQLQEANHNYIVLKGDIINASQEARPIPNLRIYLRGDCSALSGFKRFVVKWRHHTPSGQNQCILKEWIHTFSETRLLPGEKLSFETQPHRIRAGAKSLELRF